MWAGKINWKEREKNELPYSLWLSRKMNHPITFWLRPVSAVLCWLCWLWPGGEVRGPHAGVWLWQSHQPPQPEAATRTVGCSDIVFFSKTGTIRRYIFVSPVPKNIEIFSKKFPHVPSYYFKEQSSKWKLKMKKKWLFCRGPLKLASYFLLISLYF